MAADAVVPDLALSYVVRVGGRVKLRLYLPGLSAEEGGGDAGARAKLVKAGRSKVGDAVVSGAGDVSDAGDGSILECVLPPGRLARGVWDLQISPRRGARFEPTGARVLVAEPNPIALLVGPVPDSAVPSPRHTLPRRQKVARALGTFADGALRELPPEQAATTRGALRRAARKVSVKRSR